MWKKITTFGVRKDLSLRYAEIRQNLNCVLPTRDISRVEGNAEKLMMGERIELADWHLPPKYIELYDKCKDLLNEIELDYNKLKEEQQKNIIPNFNENEITLNNQNIDILTKKITDKLHKCRELSISLKTELVHSNCSDNMRKNMYQSIVNKLGELSKNIKSNEEIYIKKVKDINGDLVISNEGIKNDFFINNNFQDEQTQKIINKGDQMKCRNNELESLLKTVDDLSQIFQDCQNMILYQGTVLDRIDYNIETAQTNIKKGNKELREADENEKDSCIRKVNKGLLMINVIFGIIILIKFLK